MADTLRKVREAAEFGELDALIERQAQYRKRVTQKSKGRKERKNVFGLKLFFILLCASFECMNY
tara:strand:- start:139 stop:330 length:192 start_codon:yes stop_codon:yes gene_type:complete